VTQIIYIYIYVYIYICIDALCHLPRTRFVTSLYKTSISHVTHQRIISHISTHTHTHTHTSTHTSTHTHTHTRTHSHVYTAMPTSNESCHSPRTCFLTSACATHHHTSTITLRAKTSRVRINDSQIQMYEIV